MDRRFAITDLRRVWRALGSAETLTAGFYCIPGHEWQRFPYDVRTQAQEPGPGDGAFADVVRLRTQPGRGARGFRDRFRIRLRDDRILAAVHDRRDAPRLDPLLLYVLTHELVHVIRFAEGRATYEASPQERVREERRVHQITREVLGPARDRALDPVIRLYERYLDEIDAGADSPK